MASCQVHDHCPECGDPVVPCDDAAINRAVGSMMDAMHARAVANIAGGDAPSVRDMVVEMFRAAGGTS